MDGGHETDASPEEETSLGLRGGASTNAYPHVGSLTSSSPQGCTAVLLSRRVSVTAAHCLEGRTYAISYRGTSFRVQGTARFKAGSPETSHDVGIVVHTAIDGITPARLVAPPARGRDRLRVVGTGYDGSDTFLRATRTSLFDLDSVARHRDESGTLLITESRTDARRVDLCSGDSGSPVFLASDGRALVAIVSTTIDHSSPAPQIYCGRRGSGALVGDGAVARWLRAQVSARR